MKLSAKSGATIAVTAAALLIGGSIAAPTASVAAAKKVQCFGVNACKGQGACKTAKNDCAGKNACKGQGFVLMTAKECKAKGGKMKS